MSLQKDHVTIYDVARYAGVSIATVSRVLSGKVNVNEETKKKVLKAVKKYNYEPNLIAKALHDHISNTIGIIVQSLTNQFFINICNEAEIYAGNKGYTLLIGITNEKLKNETKIINSFVKRQVDGFIFLGGSLNDIKPDEHIKNEIKDISGRLPFVFINGNLDNIDCYIVRTDEKKAFKKIIEYVIRCNHKKIGLITGQRNMRITEEKINVFKETLALNNITVNDNWIISGEYIVESGAQSMKNILSMDDKPTVVLCANDILAIGAIKEVFDSNLKTPEDISVTGFDDIYFSKYYIPSITTVRQNYSKLARLAVDKIIKHIAGENVSKETVIDADLVVRDSCMIL